MSTCRSGRPWPLVDPTTSSSDSRPGSSRWRAAKNTADQHNSPYSSQITALSRSAVRSVDRPIDAVAVRCYEEEVDGNRSSQSRGIQLPAARRCGGSRDTRRRMMSEYTVKPGDTLWGIAHKECGDGSVWPVIYHENRWVIGNNPNLIHPGQVLHVHCPPPGGIWYDGGTRGQPDTDRREAMRK